MVTDCQIVCRGRTYFEIVKNEVVFYSKRLERKLTVMGIPIPAYLQKNFEGRQYVYKNNPLFARALVNVYFDNVLKKMGFELILKNEPPTDQMKNLKITCNRQDLT